eukprot:6483189-Amphidinium_carterae.1
MNNCEDLPSYATGEDMDGWVVLDCESMSQAECTSVTGLGGYNWAVGGTGQVYPPDAGLPLNASKRYFALQMHYYNPNLVQGLRDSSGFRLTVTPTLRQHDVGSFSLIAAVTNAQTTPLEPGQAEVWRSMQIPSSCMAASFTAAGLDE